jgi:hypothetical protein
MSDLSAYLNVYNTALVVLERKGSSLYYDKSHDWWFAEKDGWEFLADNPDGAFSFGCHIRAPCAKEEGRVLVED